MTELDMDHKQLIARILRSACRLHRAAELDVVPLVFIKRELALLQKRATMLDLWLWEMYREQFLDGSNPREDGKRLALWGEGLQTNHLSKRR